MPAVPTMMPTTKLMVMIPLAVSIIVVVAMRATRIWHIHVAPPMQSQRFLASANV